MNENDVGKAFLWGGGLVLGIIVIIFVIFVWGGSIGEDIRDEQFDECITLSQKVVPDPNDMEARSNFIKSCYETKND